MEKPTLYHEIIRPAAEIARSVGRFVIDRLWSDVPASYTGGAAMLDRELYDQPENRWDDQGNYTTWPLESDGIEV